MSLSDHGAQAIRRMAIIIDLAIAEWKVYQVRKGVKFSEVRQCLAFQETPWVGFVAYGTDDEEKRLSANKRRWLRRELLLEVQLYHDGSASYQRKGWGLWEIAMITFRSQKGFLDHHKRHTSTCSYKSKEKAKKNNRQGIEKQMLRDNGRKNEN